MLKTEESSGPELKMEVVDGVVNNDKTRSARMCKVHFNSINWISVYSLINLGFTLFLDTTGGDKCLQIDPVKKNNVSGFPRLILMRNF